jgi:long-subunit fatty acid transport protein
MKKSILVTMMVVALALTTFAGGLVTNTNQSAQYVRMLSRNASTQIDAVYFNPAGLTNLKDGWHFALNNQTIFQDKTVNSMFPLLNDGEYLGKVKAPLFPDVYAVYKMDRLALSFGFGPVGGGGSAEFERGLPSFEIPLTKLVPGLAGLKQLPAPYNYNVSGYDAELYFNGSSVYYGIQVGATYKFNDMVSGFAGVRYTPAKNTYEGYIKNIQLMVNNNAVNAKDWLTGTAAPAVTGIAGQAAGAVTTYNGAATNVQALITGGAGNFTLTQVQTAGYITSTQKAQFEAALANLGLNGAQIAAMNMNQIKTSFTTAAATYQATANQLTATAATLSATGNGLADKKVETTQTGAGWTPIVGLNLNLGEQLNVGIKYEFQTALALTNETPVDDLGVFPDGKKDDYDIPAILGVGVGYKPIDWLEAQLSYNLFFDKNVGWGNNVRSGVTREIDKNYYELALGLQFNLSDQFALSVGGLTSQPGIADSYQSDFSYSNPSYTLGGGLQWKFAERFILDAGVLNTFYKDQTVTFNDPDVGSYEETLGKTTFVLAFGLTYSIF